MKITSKPQRISMADLNGLPSLSATWQRVAEEALAELAVARTWNAWSNEGDVSLGWMRIDDSNWKILEGIYLDANSYTFQYIPIHSNTFQFFWASKYIGMDDLFRCPEELECIGMMLTLMVKVLVKVLARDSWGRTQTVSSFPVWCFFPAQKIRGLSAWAICFDIRQGVVNYISLCEVLWYSKSRIWTSNYWNRVPWTPMNHGVATLLSDFAFLGGRSQSNPLLSIPSSQGRWAPQQSLDIRCPCSVDRCSRRCPWRWRMWSECNIHLGWEGLVWKRTGKHGKTPNI